MAKELRRSSDKVIAGIVGGLSDYVDLDHNMGRILYAAVTLVTGLSFGLIIYIVCLFVMKD